jgi:DNA-damage-inducible protein D
LEYSVFRNFQPVIDKAKEACVKSGHSVADHLAEMRNMVDIGSGAQRELEDWALSRYACYLVIQNAEPKKDLPICGAGRESQKRPTLVVGWKPYGKCQPI